MSDGTLIEWSDASWNPIRARPPLGKWSCLKISPGCDHCYASTFNRRLGGTQYPIESTETLVEMQDAVASGSLYLDEQALALPASWRKPRRIFVGSMTDIAGAWVTFEWFHAMWTVMAETPRHTYQVLTKRPSRLRALIGEFQQDAPGFGPYPLPNVWVGTTIESDAYTWRANLLRQTPAAIRWISAEPLLSGLPSLDFTGIDWLVAGGESGHHARPMHPDWPRDLRDRCTESGTAYFFKQWGEFEPDWQEPHPDNPWTDDETDRSRDQLIDMTGRDCMNWTAPDQVQPFALLRRVGRKAAGRLLDGREWNEFPDALPASTPPELCEVTSDV